MLDIDAKPYQNALTYFFMPLFALTIIACYIVCCAILPVSATSADVCVSLTSLSEKIISVRLLPKSPSLTISQSGGGTVKGGPDDTVLTVYRNLRGDDDGLIFQFVGFYTQQCDPEYYPFGFLSSYLNDLDTAVESTDMAVGTIADSKALLEQECGRQFDNVLEIVENMSTNLKVLSKQVDMSLDLVKCKNINQLYVNTVHEAGCTYSVNAMAWIFSSSLVISVCGLIMIMLRAAYYPTEYLELSDTWQTMKGVPTKSASKDSVDGTLDRVAVRKIPRHHGEGPPSPLRETAPPSQPREAAPPPIVIPQSIKVTQDNADEFELGDGLVDLQTAEI